MFEKARLKLTAWYLAIIMAISLAFSVAIYLGVDSELVRVYDIQRQRQQRVETINSFLLQQGLPVPPENQIQNIETLEEARTRIIWALGIINISILILSDVGGYLLAGRTLEPISKMVDDQKKFIGNASHELRTPITSLKTEIEVALRDKNLDQPEMKKLLHSNLEDVNNMQRLSNYLLQLGRYQDSEMKIEVKRIELSEIVNSVIEKMSMIADKKNIKIKKNLAKVYVKANDDAITQLSTILIDNAIKYSFFGKSIEVSTKKGGILRVEDHGVGISPADIPHIFERFYRAELSRSKTKIDGYGLGLSIAKSIVDKLGARVEIRSKLGHGSIFTVRFI